MNQVARHINLHGTATWRQCTLQAASVNDIGQPCQNPPGDFLSKFQQGCDILCPIQGVTTRLFPTDVPNFNRQVFFIPRSHQNPFYAGHLAPKRKKSDGSLSYLILSGTVSAGELCMPKCSPSKLRCFVLSSKWEPGRTCRRFGNALPAPVPEMDWNMVSKQDEAPRIRKIKHGHGSKKKAGSKMIGR